MGIIIYGYKTVRIVFPSNWKHWKQKPPEPISIDAPPCHYLVPTGNIRAGITPLLLLLLLVLEARV